MRKSMITFAAVMAAGFAAGCVPPTGRPDEKQKKVLTAEEFRAVVDGKTKAEIKAALGPPDLADERSWVYWWRVMNPDTEKPWTGAVDFDKEGKGRASFGFKEKPAPTPKVAKLPGQEVGAPGRVVKLVKVEINRDRYTENCLEITTTFTNTTTSKRFGFEEGMYDDLVDEHGNKYHKFWRDGFKLSGTTNKLNCDPGETMTITYYFPLPVKTAKRLTFVPPERSGYQPFRFAVPPRLDD
jgi:outer membrane protein assembly factor BamE (lipoprotein component of BamABCDE complex)